MKRVIIPTDFSDNAWKAMCYAAMLYHDIPVKYIILNNYSIPYDGSEVGLPTNFGPMQEESEAGLEKILAAFKDLDHHDETEFETISNYGPVHATIAKMEDEPESHVIVMGTRGANSLADHVLGTTTAGVMENINSPVVAVPLNANLTEPKQIALAVDDRGVDNLGEIRPLTDLARKHGSTISIINIHQPAEEVVLEKDGPERFVIDHYLEGIDHKYYSIDGEFTEDKIMQFAHGMDIDLITLIHRERGFWKSLFHSSLTKRMAYHSDVPLLVLNDK